MPAEVTMWLKCDEGSGTELVNQAGAGTKKITGLSAGAWTNYNATTRPAVAIDTQYLDIDLINDTPHKMYGNPQAPAPWTALTVAMMRFSGNITFALFEPGEDPSAHSFGKLGGNFQFSSADNGFFSSTHTTADRVFGVACFTEPTLLTTSGTVGDPADWEGHFRDVYAVIEYDPSNWTITTEQAASVTGLKNDGVRGYAQAGGYTHENFDLNAAIGTWELYAGLHLRVPYGRRPKAAVDADTLLAVAKATFADWRVGNKIYSPLYTELVAADRYVAGLGYHSFTNSTRGGLRGL